MLWRLFKNSGHRGPGATDAQARAVILPGGPPFTLTFFTNAAMDRVENYQTLDVALFRAAEIKQSLLADDWTED